MEFRELSKFAKEQNIEISDAQMKQFEDFCTILAEKNKVMNLTAIDEPEEMEIKHLIDSLEGVNTIRSLAGDSFRLVDMGCGAGIPGIPLKIVFPDADFVLLDSLNKRITFVNETLSKLGISKAKGVAARAEDFAKDENRQAFDICTSRAVARLNVLLEYCLPLVKIGGHCVLYKSGSFEEELAEAKKAIEILGGEYVKTVSMELPKNGGSRSLVIIKKISDTPDKYPRRAGKPTKSPLV